MKTDCPFSWIPLRKIWRSRWGQLLFSVLREKDHNERLAEIVLNWRTPRKIYETDNRFIQKADPIFMKPGSKYGRAHFFALINRLETLRLKLLYSMC